MRSACVDIEGATDIPMRLLISAVLTSLVVPVFWSAYGDLSATITEGSVEGELSELISAVQDIMSGGVGSRREMMLRLKGWGSCAVEEVLIGGPIDGHGPDRYLIRYTLTGLPEKRIILDPLIAISTPDGASLMLSEGEYRISLVHGSADGGHVAVLSVLK